MKSSICWTGGIFTSVYLQVDAIFLNFVPPPLPRATHSVPRRVQIFQVALRDLSAGPGGLHRINLYFYDNWADEHSSRLSPGDEIAVSGPGSRLVRPDPSAGTGDHPFCITFYDDEGDGFDLADGVMGDAGGEVTVTVVKGVDSSGGGGAPGGRRGGRAARGRGRGRGRGQATQPGIKLGKSRSQVICCAVTARGVQDSCVAEGEAEIGAALFFGHWVWGWKDLLSFA